MSSNRAPRLVIETQQGLSLTLFDHVFSEAEYRLRRIARLVAPQRVAVSLDPAITVSADCNSIVILLNCDSVPFTEIRCVTLSY